MIISGDIMRAAGAAPCPRDAEPARSSGKCFPFQETLASAASRLAGDAPTGSMAAQAAEIVHLEMMRGALALDGSPAAAPAADRMDALLAIYEAAGHNGAVTAKAPGIADTSPTLVGSSGGGGVSTAAAISKASQRYGVDESLIKAVIKTESNFQPTAVSRAGAQGLMQLMPSTSAGLGVSNPFDPEQNIMAGTRFLRDLLARYGGNLDQALAAYNWGPGNLERRPGRLPQETRNYVNKVKTLYESYRVA